LRTDIKGFSKGNVQKKPFVKLTWKGLYSNNKLAFKRPAEADVYLHNISLSFGFAPFPISTG
jgi:hypothetical protein